jgi:hypothetical protein
VILPIISQSNHIFFLPTYNKINSYNISHTATLIDNIFTNNIDKIDSSINGILFSDISDHLPIVHTCCLDTLKPSKNTEEKYYTKRIYNKNSLNLFSDEIEHLSWEGTISSNNPCESFNQFSMLFTSIYEKNFR